MVTEKNKLVESTPKDDQPLAPTALAQTAVLLVLALFSILTGVAVWQQGFLSILLNQFKSWGGVQVFSDLFIALTLVLIWMWSDAKKSNRLFWPWALLTLAIGSFGPLLYLLFRQGKQTKN